MKKRVLIIFTDNQYQVVFEMMKKVAIYMEQTLGYEVCCCGVGSDYEKAKQEEWDFIFSAQGVEFAFLPQPDGKPHVSWLCDHPRAVLPRFKDYADTEHMLLGCVDKTHVTYLKRYYNIPHGFFLPHFGWEANRVIPYAERSIDVFFPASYILWEEEVKSRYEGLEGPLKIITEKTIDYLLAHDNVSIEDAFDAIFRSCGETNPDELTRECMEIVGEYVDSYCRSYYRNQVIGTLLEQGIHLTVCGRNWEHAKELLPYGHNLTVLSEEMTYTDVIEKIADSKMVLNVLPGFQFGGHERIALATLNHSVCLTDGNDFIHGLFENPTGAVIYDRKHPEELAQQIKWLLANPTEAMQIAQNGYNVAKQHLTVECFVSELLKEFS